MEKDRAVFSDLITLIDDKPVKFNVIHQEFARIIREPTRDWPYSYTFNFITAAPLQEFNVVAYYNLPLNNRNKLNFYSVKFGISKMHKGSTEKEISFGTDEYEALINAPKLEGQNLKREILKFISNVNEDLPDEKIDAEIIELNLKADRDKIESWLTVLHEAEFLKKERKESAPNRFGAGYVGRDVYWINQKNVEKVKKELGLSELNDNKDKIKVFFSYSVKNKDLAGKIKSELEDYGMDVFLAHEDIDVSDEWEIRILQELKDCEIFVALVTKPFMLSDWTYQEAGNAIGRDKKIISILHGGTLRGFLNKFQYVPYSRDKNKPYLAKIIGSLQKDNRYQNRLGNLANP